MLKTYQTSKKYHLLTLTAIFLVMFVLNLFTTLIADDYMYSLSFATGDRIEHIGEIYDSLIVHGQGVNGRYFAHFFAHLFLMLPDLLFDLVNSLVFLATVYMVYAVANRGREINNLLLLSIFGAIWLFEFDFGQINLWLDGSCNYLFAVFFGLLFLMPYINSVLDQKRMTPWLLLPHMAVAVLFGGYLEPMSVGVIGAAVLFLLVDLFYFKNKYSLILFPSILCSLVGFCIMIFAPAEMGNKMSEFSFLNLLTVFGVALLMVASIFPIIILYVVLFKRAIKDKTDPRVLITSVIIALGAIAANFVMVFAKYYALRCSVGFIFLSIFAASLLYGRMEDQSLGRRTVKFCKLFAAALILALTLGLADNVNTFIQLKKNEAIVYDALEAGERHVELDIPIAFTKYNGLMGLVYLDTDSPRNWPNFYVADYYGLDTVLGNSLFDQAFGCE